MHSDKLPETHSPIKVSVIVPAYNLERYIEECLLGVLEQPTTFEFEVVCVDDCSTDTTWSLIQALACRFPRLRALRNPRNLGLAGTQKRLLAEARGSLIAYMDGDDVALPGKLQALADHLDSHPDCALAYHEVDIFDSDTGDDLGRYSRDYYNAAYVPVRARVEHLIRYGSFLNASSVMFRRHAHLQEAIDAGCRIILDYPWHVLNALYLGGSVDRIDGVFGRYRIHAQSFGGQTRQHGERRIQSMQDHIRAVHNARRFGLDEGVIAFGVAHHAFAGALHMLKKGDDARFVWCLEQAPDGVYFDERHCFAWQHRNDPERVRERVFGAVDA